MTVESENQENGAENDPQHSGRRFPRKSLQVRASAQIIDVARPTQSPPPFHVTVQDLSRGGISFLHTEPLEAEQLVRIWLTLPSQTRRTLHALVVRSIETEEGQYLIGARFDFQFESDDRPASAPSSEQVS